VLLAVNLLALAVVHLLDGGALLRRHLAVGKRFCFSSAARAPSLLQAALPLSGSRDEINEFHASSPYWWLLRDG